MNIESDKTIRYSSETYIRRNKSNGCAVKQRPNSVVREICTLRCVGVGAILMMVPFYPVLAGKFRRLTHHIASLSGKWRIISVEGGALSACNKISVTIYAAE